MSRLSPNPGRARAPSASSSSPAATAGPTPAAAATSCTCPCSQRPNVTARAPPATAGAPPAAILRVAPHAAILSVARRLPPRLQKVTKPRFARLPPPASGDGPVREDSKAKEGERAPKERAGMPHTRWRRTHNPHPPAQGGSRCWFECREGSRIRRSYWWSGCQSWAGLSRVPVPAGPGLILP